MKACIAAGADAVYMGLPRFSARAYADNEDAGAYADAIRYAHVRGRKLYLTVNTLMKARELTEELPALIGPLYEAGLDGVIVQDLGEMRLLRRRFPELPVHASTQCTVAGPGAVPYLRALGVSRVVPARELSLREIRRIADTGIEVECFIHGALCYCYSGQCLFSSMAGGRSGNRGRCAQPCRMEYRFEDAEGRTVSDPRAPYLLSLKDLNTIERLPEILESGAVSLKIEGRMKSAEYAAGVTSVYRKYLDLLESGEMTKENYRVSRQDMDRLFDLFNRQGFTDAYLDRQNGRDMVTLRKPEFRAHEDAYLRELKALYIDREAAQPVHGTFRVMPGEPLSMTLWTTLDGETVTASYVSDTVPSAAKSRALTEEDCVRQFSKFGGTAFSCASMEGEIGEGLFLPVSAMNECRRGACAALEAAVHKRYERTCPPETRDASGDQAPVPDGHAAGIPDSAVPEPAPAGRPSLSVRVQTDAQFHAALRSAVSRIELDAAAFRPEAYGALAEACHRAGKRVLLRLPQVFRLKAEEYLRPHTKALKQAGFDEISVSGFEALAFAGETLPGVPVIADETFYAFNPESARALHEAGIARVSVPYELNYREIRDTGFSGQEMTVYGRVPMMVSAGCLKKTAGQCDRTPSVLYLTDRTGSRMPVTADCAVCMNTVYNHVPTALAPYSGQVLQLGLAVLRIVLLEETAEETEALLSEYERVFLAGAEAAREPFPVTRGHFKRGVV